MNEFNEYVRECFSEAGDIVIKPMMGGFLSDNKGRHAKICHSKSRVSRKRDCE